MTKNWIGLGVLAIAVAVSGSTCFACGEEKAADAKDIKTVAANGETKGCDMPCCAHAAAAAVAANDKHAAAPAGEKPCAATAAKGCPKKAAATSATVAKAEPAQDTVAAEPVADPGAQR
jgi:hypothetical protein